MMTTCVELHKFREVGINFFFFFWGGGAWMDLKMCLSTITEIEGMALFSLLVECSGSIYFVGFTLE